MKKIKSAPLVTEYLDIVSYLQDYYRWRKDTNKDFSYEFWSEELNFNSRSYIRMIIMGKKKVSMGFADAFCLLNFSDPTEEEYFFCLIQHSQAPSQKERKLFGAKLVQILRSLNKPEVLEPKKDFISNPALLRVFTLLGLKDIVPSTQNLAQIMNLTLPEMTAYLDKLAEFSLAKKSLVNGEVHWHASPKRFKIPDNQGNLDLFKFHEFSLQDAISAFHQEKKVRRYRSLLLPLSPDELEQIYSLLDDFASDQLNRFDPDSYQDRRLFQMNFNIHPVTNPANSEGLSQVTYFDKKSSEL